MSSNVEATAERTKEKVEQTLQNLSIDNFFSPPNFWELCKKNRNSNNIVGTSVITEAGNEVYGEDLIKDTYKKEFQNRLRERQIAPELRNYEECTKLICQLYVEESKKLKVDEYSAHGTPCQNEIKIFENTHG